MFKKIGIATALSTALLFGGAFSSSADASANVNAQSNVQTNVQYKVYYNINGQSGTLEGDKAYNLVNKAMAGLNNGSYVDKPAKEEKQTNKEEQPAKQEQSKEEQPAKQEESAKEEQAKQEQPAKQEESAKEEQAKQEQPAKQEQTQPEEQANQEQPANVQQPQQPVQQQEQANQQQTQSEQLNQFEQEVVELTNQERANHGLAPLQIDEELSQVAREKSRDMAANNYFSHNSPVHGSPFDMMQSYGIDYRTAGENIAKGQRTPAEVVDAWMNSEGHRANILNENYTHIGVGYVEQGNHWTQQFIGK